MLKNNWVIVLAVVGLIIGWNNFDSAIASNMGGVASLNATQAVINTKLDTFKSDIVEIKTSLKFIEAEINRRESE